MFPRRKRLSRDHFSPTLLAHSRRLSSAHLSVLVPTGSTKGYAVVVSKKTARLSVTRHRLKRRILGLLAQSPLPPSLIIFPKASALTLPHAELKAELTGLLSKILPRP